MLDLSAAFDTVDHSIFVERLSSDFGFRGSVLKWFTNYLFGRTQSFRFNSQISDSFSVFCGAPQASVLGPRLYSLYVAPISKIISHYNVSHHIYADDTCIYFSFPSLNVTDSINNLEKMYYAPL